MKISLENNFNKQKPTFTGNDLSERLKINNEAFHNAKKTNLGKDELVKIHNEYKAIESEAGKLIEKPNQNVMRVFTQVVKWFGRVKPSKTGNKALDTASALTHVVLWGNVGKEAVGTTLYTVQALTNQDLPPDKRKFVGMYDLAVGIISTAFSFIFGVGLEDHIKSGYKNILKPISKSTNPIMRARASVAIVGLAAFSSFALQTIIGKRIIAPAIATPVAGHLKKKLQEKDDKAKQDQFNMFPKEALILAKTPQTK